ncbi:unnamed protein product [Rotaria sp. Silwood2]|nr:unnamed protein product [Rotaria sp. Silwood2]CAF2949346.1 unnamed protein product [Rotaria sp. Silwood2]CAF3079907.1 unnamed protein product [Rotaria sp. Silwood2]CAF4165790.1 unnamed protein product [Rotaria sp. Silwood2]CAF4190078.1 unnamed protein product [Rotaria sp. Silwood2]
MLLDSSTNFCKRCPPCRGFTPVLVQFYNSHAKDKNFEIIFISSDRDENSFNEYYKEMPWLTLDFKNRAKKEEIAKKFNITGIPTLILLDGDSGEIICSDARGQLQFEDTKGEKFPWKSS